MKEDARPLGGGGGPGGQQEIGGGGGAGDGGAAEEMDRDGAEDGGSDEPPKPDGWWKWTRTQKTLVGQMGVARRKRWTGTGRWSLRVVGAAGAAYRAVALKSGAEE